MVKIPILEPLKEVLNRQEPCAMGKPIPMQEYKIEHPKNCGNPWTGAYSKHGLWFKFHEGDTGDFEKVVALSYETDAYSLNYESFEDLKTAFGDQFIFIVAKNLKGDVVGSVSSVQYDDIAVIGMYYVIEDYRHSGIGTKLFTDIIERTNCRKVLFHSLSHLAEKCTRFGLRGSNRVFNHYVLDKPVGLQSFKQHSGIQLKNIKELTPEEQNDLISYDKAICGVERRNWINVWLRNDHSDTVVACNDQGKVTGFGSVRELAGGFVKRIMIGPLYVDNLDIAKAVVYELLSKYYNPEDDHEWDPDVYAIYRRNVHMIIPEGKTEMLRVLNELKGETGKITRQRLTYRTFSTGSPPQGSLSKVFAVSDMNLGLV